MMSHFDKRLFIKDKGKKFDINAYLVVIMHEIDHTTKTINMAMSDRAILQNLIEYINDIDTDPGEINYNTI